MKISPNSREENIPQNKDPEDNLEEKRRVFFEKLDKYREEERLYNEEKIKLDIELKRLKQELIISKKRDKEEYLNKTQKESIVKQEKVQEEPETLSKVNKIIEEIPEEEKEILKETMREDIPLDFESPKVKTNYKEYLKNNVVKFFSGFKISPKIKDIIEKNAKKILLTTAILTIWTSGDSFIKTADGATINSIKNKDLVDETENKIIEIGDLETYKELSSNGKSIYLYQMTKNNKQNYLIVDKTQTLMYVIGGDGKMISKFPVLLGATKGELTNLADPDSNTAGEYATTPAGKYTLSRKGLSVTEEDLKLYDGKIISMNGGHGLAIHITYPLEIASRTKALESQTPNDNRISWGCINISKEMWIKYIQDNFKGTESIFVTTDFPNENILNPETGRIERTDKNNNFLADTFFMTTNSSGKAYLKQKKENPHTLKRNTNKANRLFAMNNINN